MAEFFAVVVLYNKIIKESITLMSLMELAVPNLYGMILDNSAEQYVELNRNYVLSEQWHYYSMNGNIGLSKAYNFALDILKEKNADYIVVWLDDDTNIGMDYFISLQLAVEDLQYDVFAPIVYGQDGKIYSPNEAGMLRGKLIKESNQSISQHKFNAINSCLAVRLRVYQNYRYDENLFMDCIDTQFFNDLRKNGLNFFVLPVAIRQNFFQRSENRDPTKYWNRFRIRIIDTMYYSSIHGYKGRICGIIRVLGWGIVYSVKLKDFSFFLKCFRQMIKSWR